MNDPLRAKRKNRKPIGYRHERFYCLDCMPDEGLPYVEELVEGDDAGVPYECWKCNKPLAPAGNRTQVEV